MIRDSYDKSGSNLRTLERNLRNRTCTVGEIRQTKSLTTIKARRRLLHDPTTYPNAYPRPKYNSPCVRYGCRLCRIAASTSAVSSLVFSAIHTMFCHVPHNRLAETQRVTIPHYWRKCDVSQVTTLVRREASNITWPNGATVTTSMHGVREDLDWGHRRSSPAACVEYIN
jgi:hypothetical protein